MVARVIPYSLKRTHTKAHSLKPIFLFARSSSQCQRQNAVRLSDPTFARANPRQKSLRLTRLYYSLESSFIEEYIVLIARAKFKTARANPKQNVLHSSYPFSSLEPTNWSTNFQRQRHSSSSELPGRLSEQRRKNRNLSRISLLICLKLPCWFLMKLQHLMDESKPI